MLAKPMYLLLQIPDVVPKLFRTFDKPLVPSLILASCRRRFKLLRAGPADHGKIFKNLNKRGIHTRKDRISTLVHVYRDYRSAMKANQSPNSNSVDPKVPRRENFPIAP